MRLNFTVLFDARHMVMILILSDYDFHPLHYYSQYLVLQSLSSTIAHIIVQTAESVSVKL